MANTAPPTADGIGRSLSERYIVEEKNTVGHMVRGMPMVAATPYLVTIAELTCYKICQLLIEPAQVTVGSRVEIDHLGASKVGATLLVEATLRTREKNRFYFDVTIKDGERIVGNVKHVRTAVDAKRLMAALG